MIYSYKYAYRHGYVFYSGVRCILTRPGLSPTMVDVGIPPDPSQQKVDLTSRKYAAARLWHARRLGLRIIKVKD